MAKKKEKIKWLTQKQIKAAAKSELAAVRCSKEHWWQIATAEEKEFLEGVEKGKVCIGELWCALCYRHPDCFLGTMCSLCELGIETCCSEWQTISKTLDDFRDSGGPYHLFKTAAYKMYKRLEALEKELT